MIKVLFICLGNICRSPMAEFILKDMLKKKEIKSKFEIASAATEAYNEFCHAGISKKAKEMLKKKGIPFTEHYSRQIRTTDYEHFDYILAMDESNIKNLKSILGEDTEHKIYRLLDFTKTPRDIKDPWYTGNYEEAYNDIVYGCEAFLDGLEI